MYWQGGPPPALAWGDVNVGQKFVAGPQWPYQTNPGFFTVGAVYTITGVNHQPDLPVLQPGDNNAPVPWDTTSAFPNTTDSNGWVTFDTALTTNGAIGAWIPTTYLANALRVG